MERIYDLSKLVVGQKYFVKCGIWQGNVLYCGQALNGRRLKYLFTFGPTVESWKDNMNLFSVKTNLKVYRIRDYAY